MRSGKAGNGTQPALKRLGAFGAEIQIWPTKVGQKLSNQPEAGTVTVVRRRRSQRHRRNRRIRRALLVMLGAAVALGLSSVALQYIAPKLFRASFHPVEPNRPSVEVTQKALYAAQQQSLRQQEQRPVYPYSVVAGGVRDVHELKWAAEHDHVVGAHYAGFDYAHARVVRLLMARSVYLSYRIGNRVYWTRRRVALKKGETLITDGKMTARTRCANRVEEQPQQESSKMEPPVAKFEEPVRPAIGTAVEAPPVPFETALMNRPGVPGLGPAPPLSLYDPIGGGSWTPIAPPPLPSVCGVGTKKPGDKGTETTTGGNGKKKNGDPCGNGSPSEVPEPGTWLLVASGLAFVAWKSRHGLART